MKRFGQLIGAVAVMAVVVVGVIGCDGDNGTGGGGSGGGGGGVGGGSGGSGSFSYGGQTYKTVKIGNQTWMAENLNVTTDNSWCYDDNPDNCAIKGRLYTWSAAMSACQSVGWRLPSKGDFDTLIAFAGGTYVAGTKLKATSGWGESGNGGSQYRNGTDDYGFSALPGGKRDTAGVFIYPYNGDWWSTTDFTRDISSYHLYLRAGQSGTGDAMANCAASRKAEGLSVRCIK
jgi:uncharacterized protein (TIGR02145 family)